MRIWKFGVAKIWKWLCEYGFHVHLPPQNEQFSRPNCSACDQPTKSCDPIPQVWQCGGSVLMIPCSHIGHLFRKAAYSFGGGDKNLIEHRNNVRILEMWLDGYKEFYYAIFPSKSADAGRNSMFRPRTRRIILALRAKIFCFRNEKYCAGRFNRTEAH